MKKRMAILLAALMALGLAGCGEKAEDEVVDYGVSVTLPESIIMHQGETAQLEPEIYFETEMSAEAQEDLLDKLDFRWVSQDPGLVQVAPSGFATCFHEGDTVLTYTSKDGAVAASTRVESTVPLEDIQAEDLHLTTLDTTLEVAYTIVPQDASDVQVQVALLEGDCVSLEGEMLTVVKPGTATLGLTCGEISKTVAVQVLLAPKELTIRDQSMSVGATRDLFVFDGLGDLVEAETGKTYTFTSADPAIATVDENGRVRGVAAGTTTVTVQNELGQSATANISVGGAAPAPAA